MFIHRSWRKLVYWLEWENILKTIFFINSSSEKVVSFALHSKRCKIRACTIRIVYAFSFTYCPVWLPKQIQPDNPVFKN